MQLHLDTHLGPILQVMKYSFITPLSALWLKDLNKQTNKPLLRVLFTSEAYHTGLSKFGTLT